MKNTKRFVRIMCLVLAALMVLSLIPAIVLAAEAERTVLASNVGGWDQVCIYFWSGSDTGMTAWPGKLMTQNSAGIYEAQIPESAQYVIFNNGGNGQQTGDLTLPAGKNLYDLSSQSWSTYEDDAICVHTYGEGTVTTAPTCTNSGSTTKTCTLCGWVTTQTVPATGHSFVDGTCTVCGHTRPTSYRLFYDNTESNWDSVYIYYWSDDNTAMIFWPGEKMVDEGDQIFSYVLPGDAQYVIFNNNNGQQTGDMEIPGDGYLYADGQWIILSVCDHSYDQGVITTEPTCTVAGVKTFTCTLCGETTTQSIAALGHIMDEGRITTEPTCVLDGVKTYSCAVCGQTTTEKVPAKGHTFDGDTCTTCGAPKECTEHRWNEGNVTQEGTCWTPGSKTVTCTVCGKTETQTIPAGHRFYIASVTEPTCTKTGKEYTKCYGCAYSMDKTLPKTDHSYTVPGATVAPTCTTDGYTVYACAGCGAEQNGDLVYHTGHKWSGNTCTACGTTCAHTFVDGICTKCDNGAPAYVEGWY
ncbi:MAG: starch-binding protein, partial [Oscillospiraceae bacterium]|nr:starch-binding protein [Oscillospiraceae bacterium]